MGSWVTTSKRQPDISLDYGARPRTIKMRFKWDMNCLLYTSRFMLNDVHSFNFMVGQEGVDYHYEGFQVTTRGQTNDISVS